MTLLREIVPGCRYRLRIRGFGEYRCPLCDADIAIAWQIGQPWAEGAVVTPTGPVSYAWDHACGGGYAAPPGLWEFVAQGFRWAVPYTWLERLPDEDYGDATE